MINNQKVGRLKSEMIGKLSQYLTVILLSVLLCGSGFVMAGASSVAKVCLDESEWYPFTLVKNGVASGIHIDIIQRAFDHVGVPVRYIPMPWRRCLKEAMNGRIDAVATASYNDERAAYMRYPTDAEIEQNSRYRVMQVEYVIMTLKNDPFQFDDNIKMLPKPVRAPRGYSVVAELNKLGLVVDDNSASDEINIKKLLREQRGSVVLIPEMAKRLSQQANYKGKLKISEKPWKSKSYFLPFSKKTKVPDTTILAIWSPIEVARKGAHFMATQAARYSVNP